MGSAISWHLTTCKAVAVNSMSYIRPAISHQFFDCNRVCVYTVPDH